MTSFPRSCVGLIVFACGVLTARADITVAPRSTTSPQVYEPSDWIVAVDRTSQNPFDPAEIAIDATFTSPEGKTLKLPAFWYQAFKVEADNRGGTRLAAEGQPLWLIRFSPTSAGQWTLSVQAKDRTDSRTSPSINFEAAGGKRPGFVRRAPASNYFQFDSGKPFFMVGLNICWSGRRGLGDYDDWFGKLADAGGNFARVWMAAPNRATETRQGGLGRYDLAAMAHYDEIFARAEKRGLYIMLALENYRELVDSDAWGAAGWPGNPYNAVNGGPATRPVDYVAHPKSREMYLRRLRYLVGRYSAYTSLAFWEFWNEQDLVKFDIPVSWTEEMAKYLKANDPYGRLVTTSYAGKAQPEVWKLPSIDLVQTHLYGDTGSIIDFPQKIVSQLRKWDSIGKPQLLAEFGIDWRGPDSKYDPAGRGVNLHNGIWTAALSGAAGSGCIWWWDNYVGPKNLWGEFTGLSRFAAPIDWPRRAFVPVEVPLCMLAGDQSAELDDLVAFPTGGFEKSKPDPLILQADGQVTGGPLPANFFGPDKKEMRARMTLKVNIPKPGRFIVKVKEISNCSMLRVWLDDKAVADWPFSALPGSPDQKSTRPLNPGSPQFVATFDADRAIDIPAGTHTIALDNLAGDWLRIGSLTFTQAMPSHYRVRRHVLADAASGQVIGWLHDTRANWSTADEPAKTFTGLSVRLPVSKVASYKFDWWDTRKGEIVRSDAARAQDGAIVVPMPPLSRDIAFSAMPVP
jgi:hypothetical protein